MTNEEGQVQGDQTQRPCLADAEVDHPRKERSGPQHRHRHPCTLPTSESCAQEPAAPQGQPDAPQGQQVPSQHGPTQAAQRVQRKIHHIHQWHSHAIGRVRQRGPIVAPSGQLAPEHPNVVVGLTEGVTHEVPERVARRPEHDHRQGQSTHDRAKGAAAIALVHAGCSLCLQGLSCRVLLHEPSRSWSRQAATGRCFDPLNIRVV